MLEGAERDRPFAAGGRSKCQIGDRLAQPAVLELKILASPSTMRSHARNWLRVRRNTAVAAVILAGMALDFRRPLSCWTYSGGYGTIRRVDAQSLRGAPQPQRCRDRRDSERLIAPGILLGSNLCSVITSEILPIPTEDPGGRLRPSPQLPLF
jgi:hypothetical protein